MINTYFKIKTANAISPSEDCCPQSKGNPPSINLLKIKQCREPGLRQCQRFQPLWMKWRSQAHGPKHGPKTFFLLHADNNWGILAFATNENLTLLQQCRTTYMDATFKELPSNIQTAVYHIRKPSWLCSISTLTRGSTENHWTLQASTPSCQSGHPTSNPPQLAPSTCCLRL